LIIFFSIEQPCIDIGSKEGLPVQEAVEGIKGFGISVDYRGKEVLAVWRYLPHLRWGIVVKIDTKEAFAPVLRLRNRFFFFGVFIIFIVFAAAFFVSREISTPITKLKEAAAQIGVGKLNTRVDVKSKDEIGILAITFNQMAEGLSSSLKKDQELALVTAKAEAEKKKSEELEFLNQQLKSNEQKLKASNQQLVAHEHQLEEAYTQLKESTIQVVQSEKLASIGEMTAGVAHELNQPLNITKIICQSILKDIERDTLDLDDVKEDLPAIVKQMDRMAQIIDHMRIFSRKTEGNMEELLDLNEVIENTFIFLDQQLKANNVSVSKFYAADLPKVKGDSIRLEQVLMNLITNARHAMEKSDKETKTLEIKTYVNEDQGGEVVVEFKDNGPGITDEVKGKMFESFFTTKKAGKGTGLGLSVVKKIIEEHKGKISVDSTLGEGATFRVVLPTADSVKTENL